ncbi:Protein HAPLESS 2 [Diplonema papillatum]|nr:Protein HAPLESS 2 [Diplonema papillatum]|eukprot:gene2119-3241_t
MLKTVRVLCGVAACGVVAGKVTSASEIEKCFDYDDESVCNVTTIIEVALQASHDWFQHHPDELVATVKTVSGENKTLETPLSLSFLTLSLVEYETQTLRLFNARPYEEHFSAFTCAGGSDSFCGYYKTNEGENIDYSSGYCCNCGLGDVLSSAETRGGACGLLSSSSSAHCMRLSDKWYEGSRILSGSYHYGVEVAITRQGETEPVSKVEVMHTYPAAKSDGITATIIAFIPHSYYDYSGQILLVPASDAGKPVVGPSLSVPENMVSIDGRECNKIGVSFEAFYGEGNRCLRSPGSCLANQIHDLLEEDSKREAANRSKLYTNQPDIEWVAQARSQRLPATILVTIEAITERVTYRTKISSGKILSVDVPPFTESVVAKVTIANTGRQRAQFTVAIRGDGMIAPDPTRPVMLGVNTTKTIDFRMYGSRRATEESEARLLEVSLFTDEPSLADRVEKNVTILKFDTGKGAQGGNQQGGASVEGSVEYSFGSGEEDTSCTSCPWYNPLCFIGRKCFISAILMFGITILCIIAFIWLARHGYLTAFFKWILSTGAALAKGKERGSQVKSPDSNEEGTPAAAARPADPAPQTFAAPFMPFPQMHPYFATAPPMPLVPQNPLGPLPPVSLPTHKHCTTVPPSQATAATEDESQPVAASTPSATA